ncbi:MAG: hypothetical protein EHM41_00225 [Chloroflexi bacterium]|nr:MAG: hypothetical protein EHM41_00225 [Chloroflexota bacterium]
MTIQEQIDLIATEIHGWHKERRFIVEVNIQGTCDCWVDKYNKVMVSVLNYSPFTNIQQAIDALEKFCRDKGYEAIIKITGLLDCVILYTIQERNPIVYEDNNLATAITDALIEAIGEGK